MIFSTCVKVKLCCIFALHLAIVYYLCDTTAASDDVDGGSSNVEVCSGSSDFVDGQCRQIHSSSSSSLLNEERNVVVDNNSWSVQAPEPLVPQRSSCNLYYDWTTSYDGLSERLGLFTLNPISKHYMVGHPGLVIQVTDPPSAVETNDVLFQSMLEHYAVDSHLTGGQYEGTSQIFSILPGLGMTRIGGGSGEGGNNNYDNKIFYNVVSYKTEVDEADLTRTESPGAGAISHYYNLTYYAVTDLNEGDEIVFGSSSFLPKDSSTNNTPIQKSGTHLVNHGMCADNLKVDRSKLTEAGRGAFVTRVIPKGGLIAPVPVLPIKKRSLHMTRPISVKEGNKIKKKMIDATQLLMNYCFGHKDSDILLFPYSSGVNLINHANGDNDRNFEANAKLQWSLKTYELLKTQHNDGNNVEEEHLVSFVNTNSTLVLDLVATREILPGEEIFLDYGTEWTNAWKTHVTEWKPAEDDINAKVPYAPAYVMNEVTDRIRTKQEQDEFYAYPDNLQMACFYKYSDMVQQKKVHEEYDTTGVTMIKWRPTRDITNLRYLRPCQILQRDEDESRGTSRYTVKMLNRPGNMTPPEERIPPKELSKHLVMQVPRPAIRFVDKPYTTDQHLPNAFRHYIPLPDTLLPPAWRKKQIDQEETITQ